MKMSDLKHMVPTKLLWIDLEMTGLNPEKDVILEVAAVVTDFNFAVLDSYESHVAHPRELIGQLQDANPWYDEFPENKRYFMDNAENGLPDEAVERELLDFLKRNFGDEPAVLAGNSIHNDRNFIKKWWPGFDSALHYRMLDVSAWKVFLQGRYDIEYKKGETHRAVGDIHESIAELKYYLDVLPDLAKA